MPRSSTVSRDLEEIYTNLWRAPVCRARDPTRALRRHRLVTCLIWTSSGSPALAEAYLLRRGVSDYSPERCVLLFSEWLLSDHHAVLIAMMDIEDTFRVDADCFLARSLTAMNVHIESSKGVFVSTSESVYHYLCYWSLRPVATLLQPVLARLNHHRNARRKFGQLLRQEWMLNYGTFKKSDM